MNKNNEVNNDITKSDYFTKKLNASDNNPDYKITIDDF